MNYYISADIEGLSGYGHPGIGDNEIMLAHMKAMADGLADGGADGITLSSFHGIPDGLPERVTQIRHRAPGEFDMPALTGLHDGLLLLGFHGLFPGSFGHSYKYKNLWLNGRPCGEVTIQMWLAASKGVPTLMIAGDDRSIPEAREVVADLTAVSTREGRRGDEGPINPAVLEAIRRTAAACVGRRVPAPAIPASFTLEVPFRTDLAARYATELPYPTARNGRIVGRQADNFADVYAFLLDCFDCTVRARKVEGLEPFD